MCAQSEVLVVVVVVVEAAGVVVELESLDAVLVLDVVVLLDELDEPERLSVL